MLLLLKNATFIDSESLLFRNISIEVEEGINGKIIFHDKLPAPSDLKDFRLIDCTGKYVTKSFACGHHHAYSALARGMGAPKKPPENFYEILQYVWWTLDKCLDREMIEASALATAVACAKNGVTFVIDHHASPNHIHGSLDIIAKAFDKVGVSHLLCYEITDRDGFDKAEQGLSETESYLENNQGLVGLHASFTVGEGTLKKSVALARKYQSGIHVHTAEDLYDETHCKKEYGKSVVRRLKDSGALESSKTILGHCLHIDEAERSLIKNSPAWVVQNAESNLNNNVGFFNSAGLGQNIMLGTDGMHSDMLRSAKAAFYVGQRFDSIDYPGVYKRFRNVHRYTRENNFIGDGDNNLVVLDYDTPTEFNQSNFPGHFLFGIDNRHVQHVISSGKLIVENRKIVNLNEEEILKFSKEQSMKLWNKMKG